MKTEHEEQREFVMWMRQTHPDARILAIPNGGATEPNDRREAEGGRRQRRGAGFVYPEMAMLG